MKQQGSASQKHQARKQTSSRRSSVKSRSTLASDGGGKSLSGDERRALIAEVAYLRAEARGFTPGGETDDWLQAEVEVDGWLLRS